MHIKIHRATANWIINITQKPKNKLKWDIKNIQIIEKLTENKVIIKKNKTQREPIEISMLDQIQVL